MREVNTLNDWVVACGAIVLAWSLALASVVFPVYHPSRAPCLLLSAITRGASSICCIYIKRKMSFTVNHAISALKKDDFDRSGVEDLMKRRFIVAPSFQIYSGAPAGMLLIFNSCRFFLNTLLNAS